MPDLLSELSRAVGRAASKRVVFPVRGGRISGGVGRGHRAIDIAAPVGTPTYATMKGMITAVTKRRGGYGTNIRLRTVRGEELVYAHLGEVFVRPGQRVQAGDILGNIGLTGQTSGAHLHFERRLPGLDIFRGGRSTTSALDPWELLGGAAQPSAATLPQKLGGVMFPTTTTTKPTFTRPTSYRTTGERAVPTERNIKELYNMAMAAREARPETKKPLVDIDVGEQLGRAVKPHARRVTFFLMGGALVTIGLLILVAGLREEIGRATINVVRRAATGSAGGG